MWAYYKLLRHLGSEPMRGFFTKSATRLKVLFDYLWPRGKESHENNATKKCAMMGTNVLFGLAEVKRT